MISNIGVNPFPNYLSALKIPTRPFWSWIILKMSGHFFFKRSTSGKY
jgi:hypothetical protein